MYSHEIDIPKNSSLTMSKSAQKKYKIPTAINKIVEVLCFDWYLHISLRVHDIIIIICIVYVDCVLVLKSYCTTVTVLSR